MAKNVRTVLVAACRGISLTVPALITLLDGLKDCMPELVVILGENDSEDDTTALLRQNAVHRPWLKVCELGSLDCTYPVRTDRLAVVRNLLLNEAKRVDPMPEFFVVVDSDNVIEGVSVDHVLKLINHLQQHQDVAAAFCNSLPAYYDIWTLRHTTWSADDCWEQVKQRPWWMPKQYAIQKYVRSRQRIISAEEGPIDVDSAFNGLGVYRLGSTTGATYSGHTESGIEACEHVSFNHHIARTHRLQIIPSVIIEAPAEHLRGPKLTLESVARSACRRLTRRRAR